MKKVLNLKLVIMQEDQNTKKILKEIALQIGLKKILWSKKFKKLKTLLVNLMTKILLECFGKRIAKDKSKGV